jgi:hypothetical protein
MKSAPAQVRARWTQARTNASCTASWALALIAGHGVQLADQPREAGGVEDGELLAIHLASAFSHCWRCGLAFAHHARNTRTTTSWLHVAAVSVCRSRYANETICAARQG